MEWLARVDLLDLIIGAALGSLLTYLTAREVGRRTEQGRVEEIAHHRLADLIRRYQAQVSTAPPPSTPRSAMTPHPLSSDSRLAFACGVEGELRHLNAKTATVMRGYLEQLVGPACARQGQRLADLPAEQWTATAEAESFMYAARGLSAAEVSDNGLLGRAAEARTSTKAEVEARDAAATVLAEMARSLQQRR